MPRQELTPAPHASYAVNADRLDGLHSTAFLQAVPNPLALAGSAPADAAIISGTNDSTAFGSCGLFGESTSVSGAVYGIYGRTASGFGVHGRATSAADSGIGGEFVADGQFGTGVYGLANDAIGPNYGGYFVSYGAAGMGVYASSSGTYGAAARTTLASGTAYGGHFESISTNGKGVLGLASASTGSTVGVFGYCYSPTGTGVYGWAPTSGGLNFGGYFQSNSATGVGVFGQASATSGATKAVMGECLSPSGHAVYAAGNFAATGTKSFRIDHPDDPENKYLVHYCPESPEVLNFYRGNVVLDVRGEAVVELPAYFARINKDPSYQLTAVGAPMPMLHVAGEIDASALSAGPGTAPGRAAPACSFRIAGGAPGAKVSWRVEAVRNDRWVQTRGAPVEVQKAGAERGTYQHPDLFGQPAEKRTYDDASRSFSLAEGESKPTPGPGGQPFVGDGNGAEP